MTRLKLEFPLPPSGNKRLVAVMGRNGKPTMVQRKADKDWMRAAVRAIREQLPPGWMTLTGPVLVTYEVEVPTLSSDGPNRHKTLEDTLAMAGVIQDDRQVARTIIDKLFGPPDACVVRVTVEPFDRPELAERLERAAKAAEKRAAKTKPRKVKGVTVTPNVRMGSP